MQSPIISTLSCLVYGLQLDSKSIIVSLKWNDAMASFLSFPSPKLYSQVMWPPYSANQKAPLSQILQIDIVRLYPEIFPI